MGLLENCKTYTGKDLEQIFFRPMLTGPSALDLGVRVLYNMPVPTTVQVWEAQKNVLKSLTAANATWTGGNSARKFQKTIELKRVKAEMGYGASDYFSLVYELISARPEVNMGDLCGTELEEAETALFKQSIAEGIRSTVWAGDTTASTCNTFDGFLKKIKSLDSDGMISASTYTAADASDITYAVDIFDSVWSNASEAVKDHKGDGQLVYFVSSDIYNAYEKYLDGLGTDGAYTDHIHGRQGLMYHGIPVVDVRVGSYVAANSNLHRSFCLLTDRRNLAVAVNTSDFPGTEIRMWYNPDEMENRQRAVFMIGCEILDEEAISYAYGV